MVEPLVSIIVPTLNRPRFLLAALSSIKEQTYTNFDVFVINDGGNNVTSVIDSLNDPRFHYLQHDSIKGSAAARNTALKQCAGKYIAYLDDDDLYYPDHIETLVQGLEKNPQYEVAHSDWNYAYKHETEKKIVTEKKEPFAYEVGWPDILIDNRLATNSVMHKHSIFTDVGYYDETLFRHEDWDLWIKLRQRHSFLHIHKISSEYTRSFSDKHSQSLTSWVGFFLNTMQIIHKRYHSLAMQYPDILQKQAEVRDRLRKSALSQLMAKSPDELKAIDIDKIMEEISQSCLDLQDIKGTRVLTNYLTSQLPDHPTLWLIHAGLCKRLGDQQSEAIALYRAQHLIDSQQKH